MRFKNPPVTEAWIEFYPDLNDETIGFGEKEAKEFLQKTTNFKLENINYLIEQTTHIKDGKVEFEEPKPTFKRIRAKTDDKSACIQLERALFVYNQIKTGDTWPGYEKMRDEAYKMLELYLKHRGLVSVQKMSLHYRDLISIPKGSGRIELHDFFNIVPQVKGEDVFGNIAAFNLSIQFPNACAKSITDLSIATIITSVENPFFQFIMDWHISSNANENIGNDNGRNWIEAAHTDLRRNFFKAITEKAIQTIGTIEE